MSIHAIHHYGTCYSQHFLEPPVLLTLAVLLPKAGYPQLGQDRASTCNSKEDTGCHGGLCLPAPLLSHQDTKKALTDSDRATGHPAGTDFLRQALASPCDSRHPVTSFLGEAGISGPGHLSVKLQEWQCPFCQVFSLREL